MVAGFLRHLRTGDADHRPLAASSAARTLVAVRGLHKFLASEGETSHDPAQAVAPPAPPSRLPKAISVSEVERLLDASSVGDPPVTLRDRALLEVLYGAGLRISEAVGLDLDDLDLGDGGRSGDGNQARDAVVRVIGKGSKQRLVPLGSYAVRAITDYLVRARPELAARGRGRRHSSSTCVAAACRGSLRGRSSRPQPGEPVSSTSHRIPSGTRSPPTCWTGERTCVSCRSCSAMHR